MSRPHRRHGIGRALVHDLEREIAARGGLTLWLGSDDENNETTVSGVDSARGRARRDSRPRSCSRRTSLRVLPAARLSRRGADAGCQRTRQARHLLRETRRRARPPARLKICVVEAVSGPIAAAARHAADAVSATPAQPRRARHRRPPTRGCGRPACSRRARRRPRGTAPRQRRRRRGDRARRAVRPSRTRCRR